MVIENINKYRYNQIESLENPENTIRLIVKEEPDSTKVEVLKNTLINQDTIITLVFSADDNNTNYQQLECIKDNIFAIESYNRKTELKSISGISMFSHLEKITITDLYNRNLDLSELKTITSLKELCLLYNDLTKNQHILISDLKQLEVLKVKGFDVDMLTPLPNIKQLDCYNLKSGKSMYEKLPQLQTLSIHKSSKDLELDFLSDLSYLVGLEIDGLSHIQKIPNLNNLVHLRRLWLNNMKNLECFPMLNKYMEFIKLSGNLSKLNIECLSELTPDKLPNIKRIAIDLGSDKKSDIILKRFFNICESSKW
ncbi:hypothetical protein [Bacteroides ovatus]|uniref:hypothetical protein n=1 Tax=Bacteroides ovatus TaxID=28116 RepID=UPI0021654E1B|nr:hypothetical protein [Bacteroides ovatus]MCS2301358.1 hypothetical protein [Bacteroides ovatus]